jgi:acyl-CoA synthetase (AMP-forming)/AMP-acid ligase II
VGLPHPVLGQSIAVAAVPLEQSPASEAAILDACRRALPAYMLPARVELRAAALPRNPNGKIDRKLLSQQFADVFAEQPA